VLGTSTVEELPKRDGEEKYDDVRSQLSIDYNLYSDTDSIFVIDQCIKKQIMVWVVLLPQIQRSYSIT
jgi:hypothetical protein